MHLNTMASALADTHLNLHALRTGFGEFEVGGFSDAATLQCLGPLGPKGPNRFVHHRRFGVWFVHRWRSGVLSVRVCLFSFAHVASNSSMLEKWQIGERQA